MRFFCFVAGVVAVSLLGCGSSQDGETGRGAGGQGVGQGGSVSGNGGNAAGGDAAGGAAQGGSGGRSNVAGASSGDGGDDTGGRANIGTDGGATDDGGAAQPGDYWRPTAGLTWQWQLSEEITEPLDVDMYDVDWEVDEAVVTDLHALGIKVICYVSVGSWEDFRPDANDFPAEVIGEIYDGWPGERYVDIRSNALRTVMLARFDACQQKGFDAIEPDNMDVYELGSDSGFPLTEQDGIDYALWMADEAHARGMGIGQKNASGITEQIIAQYQWALTESCYSDGDWCGDVSPYAEANKPVFMCEYEEPSFADACSNWQPAGFSPILKNLDLDAPITFCQ